MVVILIVGWVALLMFVAWEFVVADKLPEKYSKLKPRTFRIADIAIGLLAILSIWWLATN